MAFVLRNSQLHRRLHGNAKLLCILHYIWTIGLCIAYIINYGFNLIQLSMSFSNPCEYLIPTSLSFNLAATVMIFILLQMTSMIALAIERTVATIRYEKYENEKNIILLILLIILQFAVSFLIPYVYLIPSTNWEQPAVGPSLVTDDNLEKNQIFTIAFIVSELVVTIYIYALRYLNYYRRKAVRKWNSQSGLSTRYQLDENIRALNLIVPLIWLQFIFNFTTAVMVYIIVAVGFILFFFEFYSSKMSEHRKKMNGIDEVRVFSMI
uniref:G_PROTEIN_RECEP_F1_2 domain-containing protein n=1 Tax=Ascaris lumbricoides TaxID=6252 RepID=A0A0M3ING0_ASCLU